VAARDRELGSFKKYCKHKPRGATIYIA